LRTKEIIEEAKTMQNPLGDEIRQKLDEIKNEELKKLEAAAKKNKKIVVNPDLIIPRFTPEMMWKVYIYKLSQRMYQNKGFILDGFPKTYEDANHIFLEIIEKKSIEGEENKEETEIDYESLKPNSNMPQKVVIFEGTDEQLNSRLEKMPEEKKKDSHYNTEGMTRRLKEYKDRNDENNGIIPLAKFFEKRNIEVLTIKAEINEEITKKTILDCIEKVIFLFLTVKGRQARRGN